MLSSRVHSSICSLFETAGQDDQPGYNELVEVIQSPYVDVWMARQEPSGEVIGFATVELEQQMAEAPEDEDPEFRLEEQEPLLPDAVIVDFVFVPALTTSPIGKQLLDRIKLQARSRGAQRLVIGGSITEGDFKQYLDAFGFERDEESLLSCIRLV